MIKENSFCLGQKSTQKFCRLCLEGRIKGINSGIKRNELNVFQKNKQPLRGVAEEGEGGNIMQSRKKIFAKYQVQVTITNSQCP